jgi:ABC transporter substrate binding protein
MPALKGADHPVAAIRPSRVSQRKSIVRPSVKHGIVPPLHGMTLTAGRMAIHLRRREFVTLIGAAAWMPLAAQAQPQVKLHRIGYLSSPAGSAQPPLVQAFRDGLHDFGYVEGRSIAIEWRFSRSNEELPSLANELVQLNLEAVVATGGPAIRAIKQLTDATPIVMAFSGDPIGTGLIGSLGRPGGNLTGLSMMSPDLSGKRLENSQGGIDDDQTGRHALESRRPGLCPRTPADRGCRSHIWYFPAADRGASPGRFCGCIRCHDQKPGGRPHRICSRFDSSQSG